MHLLFILSFLLKNNFNLLLIINKIIKLKLNIALKNLS